MIADVPDNSLLSILTCQKSFRNLLYVYLGKEGWEMGVVEGVGVEGQRVSLGSRIVFSPLSRQVGLQKLGHLKTKRGYQVIPSLPLMAPDTHRQREGWAARPRGLPPAVWSLREARLPSCWPRAGTFSGLSFGATV